MGTITRNRRVTRPVAAAVGLAAVALAGLAAPAGATATRIAAQPGISLGSATNYGTGCGYDVNGYVDDPSTPVVFFDNGIPFAVAKPSGWLSIGRWTPTTTGVHRITIIQHTAPGEDVIPYVDITVGTGLNSGSGCPVVG